VTTPENANAGVYDAHRPLSGDGRRSLPWALACDGQVSELCKPTLAPRASGGRPSGRSSIGRWRRSLIPQEGKGEMPNAKGLTAKHREELLGILKTRFENHMSRHEGLDWQRVAARLGRKTDALWSLGEMERTGGEPDVVAYDKKADEYVFYDCSAESPAGRRSVCYDREGLESRREHRPEGNAIDMAAAMGIELLTEDQYRKLQAVGRFDEKTSSWVKTPPDIRKLGGALFCDRRYGHVFVYHNGAQSYYAARGFRGSLKA
jgi:hypothetical protein